MTISYNWLLDYLPVSQVGVPEMIEPSKLSKILTAVGLEVESMEKYESIKGGLKGLLIGEVMECSKHPGADKLTLTKVNIGSGEPLQIVCGAPNVAAGQKVVVATIGTTIYPCEGDPITMKKAKIRGEESQGMICAEDEIGLGTSHAGIIVLNNDVVVGTPAAEYFKPYEDHIYEIGLTPNRMDAMCHIGVAKDVCAYLSHHNRSQISVQLPYKNDFKSGQQASPITVTIENAVSCRRYTGISIEGVTIKESPEWMQQKLRSIGLRPINNIVDITNFILHETGQPLHAFDQDEIRGKKIIVKNLPEGTPFITLDEKERKLSAEDPMICDAERPVCIGGVYGGLHSGVTEKTTNIFLESAWFDPISIRRSSVRHGLRTDAASRFEKGVDISNAVNVLKRAALLIKEIGGGEVIGDVIDIYPSPLEKKTVTLKNHYLKKLSGKNYHSDTVKNILTSLGFEILKEGADDLYLAAPFSKPDISIPADIVEEIMRIDGLDNVEIPAAITISPAAETLSHASACREKISQYLSGSGFNEIFTNSITNSAYYDEEVLKATVKMINNLTEELNIMRPDMMATGLESVSWNLNRKNSDLRFYEFGKTYSLTQAGKYAEQDHLAIYITGKKDPGSWQHKAERTDFYFLKGAFEKIMQSLGLQISNYVEANSANLSSSIQAMIKNEAVATLGTVDPKTLDRFDIRQPVFYADMDWDKLIKLSEKKNLQFTGIPKYPAVHRDLAMVVDRGLKYEAVEKATQTARINKLKSINLFDVFESEKLGAGKKSMAVSFTFLDEEKTMTDKEIDTMMSKIIAAYEKELNAEIRKQ
jgi:phenylalanyl-tRNA synthetase beta chain